jgi:hypothetical protein
MDSLREQHFNAIARGDMPSTIRKGWEVRVPNSDQTRLLTDEEIAWITAPRKEEQLYCSCKVVKDGVTFFAISCKSCNGTGVPLSYRLKGEQDRRAKEKEKPLRLLVEIVPKKDEKHGTQRHSFADGTALSVFHPISSCSEYPGPAMSVRELPPIPTLKELRECCKDLDYHTDINAGLKAVLKACGLEPAE